MKSQNGNEIDPKGYLESKARPNEVRPRMRQNNAALEPIHKTKVMPVNGLNLKMKGEC